MNSIPLATSPTRFGLSAAKKADTVYRRLARKTAQVGHLLLRSFALLGHSQVLADLGRLEGACAWPMRAQESATTISWPRFVASAEGTRGYIHFLNGALERAEEDLLSAVTQLSSIRATDAADYYPFLVEIAGRQQRFDKGRAYLQDLKALPLSDAQWVSVLTSEYVLRSHEGRLKQAGGRFRTHNAHFQARRRADHYSIGDSQRRRHV